MYKQQNLYETILPQPNILHHLEPTSEDFRMLLLSRRVSNMLRMQVDCRLIIQWVAINSKPLHDGGKCLFGHHPHLTWQTFSIHC